MSTGGVAGIMHGVAHSDAHVTMCPFAPCARRAGSRMRAIVSSALLLVLPARALAKDRTLCFLLPSPSSLTEAPRDPGADPDPARVYLGMNAERCVPRAERDLRAAAVRARLPEDDPGLRCVDAHESFLCAADLAAADDPFSCETLDGSAVYPRNETTMETCVWPVCEALCVQHPVPAVSRADRRRGAPRHAKAETEKQPRRREPSSARKHSSTCARCGRACAVSPPRGGTSGGRYCEALAAQRRDEKASARYGNAWGCPGCDGETSFGGTGGFEHLEAATFSPLASRAQISAAAAALGSASSVSAASGALGSVSVATAASASAAVLVGNFLFVSARVALLNALFWAAVDRLYVVARPGEPLPGYVYAQGGRDARRRESAARLAATDAAARSRRELIHVADVPSLDRVARVAAIPRRRAPVPGVPGVPGRRVRRRGPRAELRGRVRHVHLRAGRGVAQLLLRRRVRRDGGLLRRLQDVLRRRVASRARCPRGRARRRRAARRAARATRKRKRKRKRKRRGFVSPRPLDVWFRAFRDAAAASRLGRARGGDRPDRRGGQARRAPRLARVDDAREVDGRETRHAPDAVPFAFPDGKRCRETFPDGDAARRRLHVLVLIQGTKVIF